MVMIAYGTRQSFGLYMQPMSVDMGWGREVLSVALATQNLLMGAGAAFAGALATRWGAAKTIAIGGGLYASGLFFMSQSTTPEALFISSGILSGLGLSARGVSDGRCRRSNRAGTCPHHLGRVDHGSCHCGQLVMLPFTQYLLGAHDCLRHARHVDLCRDNFADRAWN